MCGVNLVADSHDAADFTVGIDHGDFDGDVSAFDDEFIAVTESLQLGPGLDQAVVTRRRRDRPRISVRLLLRSLHHHHAPGKGEHDRRGEQQTESASARLAGPRSSHSVGAP